MIVWTKLQTLWQRHNRKLLRDELGREAGEAATSAYGPAGGPPIAHTVGQLFDEATGSAPLSDSDSPPPGD